MKQHSGWFHLNQWVEDDEGFGWHRGIIANRVKIRYVHVASTICDRYSQGFRGTSRLFRELMNDFETKDRAIVVFPTWSSHRWRQGFQNPKMPLHLVQVIHIEDNNFTLLKSRTLTDVWLNVHGLTHLNLTIGVEGGGQQARMIKDMLRSQVSTAMKANESTLTSVTWHAPHKTHHTSSS